MQKVNMFLADSDRMKYPFSVLLITYNLGLYFSPLKIVPDMVIIKTRKNA